MTIKKLKNGDCVISNGFGKTKDWGNTVGSVTKRLGEKVFVVWEEQNSMLRMRWTFERSDPTRKPKKSSNLID